VVGVIAIYDSAIAKASVKEDLLSLSLNITSTLTALLRVNSTISIGDITESLGHIPNNYEHTRELLRFRDVHQLNQILDVEDFPTDWERTIDYPLHHEQDIIQRSGWVTRSWQLRESQVF
jgi:hypothetical protein